MMSRNIVFWFAPLVGFVGCEPVDDEAMDPPDVLEEPSEDGDADLPGEDAVGQLTDVGRPTEAVDKVPDALIVAPVAQWRYLNQSTKCATSYPTDRLGRLWRSFAFNPDDLSPGSIPWAAGRAELGYGDGDEATVVPFGGNPDNKCVTQFFRLEFTVAEPTLYESLILHLLRDDGAAVYLNNVEIKRDNLPSGFGINTLASSQVEDSAEDRFNITTGITEELLVGKNVLAVEVHQRSKTNPDVSFNLALLGRLANPGQYTTRAFVSAEATIDQSSPNSDLGGDDECKVDGRSGPDNSDPRDQVCLARWNLMGTGGLPAGAQVLAAHIEADVNNGSPDRYEVYQLATNWSEFDVTWNDSDTDSTADWIGGVFGPSNFTPPEPLTVVNALSEGLQFYELPPANVQTWVNKNPPGIAFFNTLRDNGIDFDSDGVGLELVVTYRLP